MAVKHAPTTGAHSEVPSAGEQAKAEPRVSESEAADVPAQTQAFRRRAEVVAEDEVPALLAAALGLKEGDTPFPWQTRLLQRMREGDIPRSLDVPTGLGKTATIAVWLLARALGAAVPRRLVYVVDRRAVVDQATEEAARLREWVAEAGSIKGSLLPGGGTLPVSTLRGQLVDNRDWLEDPSAPAIVVGTVDLIGSRLLFEGYRASRKIRPYMAGLLGHDTLFVLDEAHLVPPFERLLERIMLEGQAFRGSRARSELYPPSSKLLSLSATGRSRGGAPFDLDPKDLAHPTVKRRLAARKQLVLEPLGLKTDLASAAAERAWRLTEQGARAVGCLIFLSRREDAEKALGHLSSLAGLDKLKKGQEPSAEVELLVGGRRVFERTRAAGRLEELGFLAGERKTRTRPAFLVATSAGEVGVDLDADHMVGDLVPWERMVQRLGRVNRRGLGDAEVVILDATLGVKEGPVDDARRAGVRALFEQLPLHEDGSRDVSPGALRDLQRAARSDSGIADAIARASTPDPLYPQLDRATIDAWSMTSLKHHPGRPIVAPWLRGWIEDRPQTTVVWRRLLPLVNGARPNDVHAKRYFEAAPLHASELLEAETFRVVEWAAKRAKKLLAGAKKGRDGESLRADEVVAALLQDNGEKVRWWTLQELAESPKKDLDRALPGAELVVDARFGGISEGLLDASADGVPPTLDGDLDCDDTGKRVIRGWLEAPFRARKTSDGAAIDDEVWRERVRLPLEQVDGEVVQWLVVEKRQSDSATEEDRSAGRPQKLAEHHEWTAKCAEVLAERVGLPREAGRLLGIAARLHDEGKRAARWQAAFKAPSLQRKDGREPYAKTRGPVNVHLLDGYRHEFGSLPYAERDPEVLALSDEERDLVLHLIASHHGFARPSISTSGCEDAPPSALEERARQVALRFLRVQERWGPWGLAWWEALLRAADQQASRMNDEVEVRAEAGRKR